MGCSVTTATSRISVSPAIRMSSAISFGVFCRLAPSTRAIMRSRNVSPGLEVIWTTIRSDSTMVPPVTALRSPPDSRITGADSPVMADSSTMAIPSITSPSPGMTCPAYHARSPACSWDAGISAVVPSGLSSVGDGFLAAAAQGVGLGLAPALGHRFGEVGEQHRRPQPQRDQPDEHVGPAEELDRGDHAADLDHEHDRVADHRAGVELDERLDAPRGAGSTAPAASWPAGCGPSAAGSPPAVRPGPRGSPGRDGLLGHRRPPGLELGPVPFVAYRPPHGAGDHAVDHPDQQGGRGEEGHDGGDENDVGHVGPLEPSGRNIATPR